MTDAYPHQGYVGRLQVPAMRWAVEAHIRADMAQRLDADPREIYVVEIPDEQGVNLVGSWVPP